MRNPIFHSTKSITTIFTKQRRTDEKVHGTCQITHKNLTKISPFFAYTYTEKNFHLADETCAFGIHNIFIAYKPTDTLPYVHWNFSFAFSSFFALFYYTIHLDWDLNTLSNYVFMILCVNTNCETHTLFHSSSYRIALTCRKNENSWLIDTNHLVLQTTLKTIRIRGTGRY